MEKFSFWTEIAIYFGNGTNYGNGSLYEVIGTDLFVSLVRH